MKKLLGLLSGCALILSCNDTKEEQTFTMGNLQISNAKPTLGETIRFQYNPKDNIEHESQAMVHYLVHDKSYPKDLSLSKEGTHYESTLKLPDSITAVALNFKQGSEYDSNDEQGFIIPLYGSDGELIKGNETSSAWFKLTQGSQYGYSISADSAYSIINKKYTDSEPEFKERWAIPLIRISQQVDKKRSENLMDERISSLANKDLSEAQFEELQQIYRLKKEDKKLDSITSLASNKFPKGTAARSAYNTRMDEAKTIEEKLEVLKDYNKAIGQDSREKDNLLYSVANAYQEKGDYENYDKYASAQQNIFMKLPGFNNAAWNLRDEDPENAAELSKKSLQLVENARKDTKAKPDYMTESQYTERLGFMREMYADTYAYILNKLGNTKEALQYQELALGDRKSADVNERYIQFLVADEQYEKAKKEAESFIKMNVSTEKTKEYLEEAYKKTTSTSNDFDSYLASLEKEGEEKAIADLKASMIDEEAPQFSLNNLEGEKIALADLKGKTVVLDFWATWCGPCKDSFPGMQKALDKFQDDPNVEFLFVDTWESTNGEERLKNVSDFIKENEYSFNVLMDTPVEEGSNQYSVVSDYEVDGIPTKFVLGPDGRIKFKAVGYNGSTDALAKEIDLMIDLAKS